VRSEHCRMGLESPGHSSAMKRLAFISRHAPTQEQIELAATLGFEIIHVGDVDAFAKDLLKQVADKAEDCDAIAAVHPNILLTQAAGGWYRSGKPVWVFKNENRPAEGGAPQFFCTGVTIWEPQMGEGFFEMSQYFISKDNPFAGVSSNPPPCRSV